MERYQVTGATMEEVDGQLQDPLGEFYHSCAYRIATRTVDDVTTVTGVTLPVQYHYRMPQWTRVGEQTPEVQAAWNRFYADLMAHEREHLAVSRREYTALRAAIQAIPAAERTEERIATDIDTAIGAQNAIHESHAGFTTPSTLVFADYIPAPPPAPESTGEGEGETESESE
jgi:predicted secreted Zn-dependent protease